MTRTPKTKKCRDERGVANNGSYRETLAPSTAWDIRNGRPMAVPAGSLISVTSGGFQSGLNATCMRGHVRVADKEIEIAYLA